MSERKEIKNKEDLIKVFEEAKENILDVALELTVKGSKFTEIIVTKYGNLDLKLKYYLNNYNDELKLERCKEIQILSAKLDVWEE